MKHAVTIYYYFNVIISINYISDLETNFNNYDDNIKIVLNPLCNNKRSCATNVAKYVSFVLVKNV